MEFSRRAFFKSIIPKIETSSSMEKTPETVILGHVTAFPANSSTKIQLYKDDFLIESYPEGLRLKKLSTNENLKLSLSSAGLLQAHIQEIWPENSVLSIFTGEIYNL